MWFLKVESDCGVKGEEGGGMCQWCEFLLDVGVGRLALHAGLSLRIPLRWTNAP